MSAKLDKTCSEPSAPEDSESADPPRQQPKIPDEPSLEPYLGRLERLELFSTNQCYYIIGSNKLNNAYRIIKIDRTLIEKPSDLSWQSPARGSSPPSDPPPASSNESNAAMADNSHTAKPTLRPLSDFLTEDPNVYTQEEIRDMLDMIHDGNRMTRADGRPGDVTRNRGGGLKPIVKAYGIVGFIRFLDCYYLTLITKRAKVGSIGGNGVYTIKNTETIPLKPAERSPMPLSEDLDPSSVLLSMWNRGKRSVGLGLTNREIAELRYQGLYQVVDLSKMFFFSYTYDLTRSLQENFLATTTQPFPPPPFKDLYAWNFFLTREFEGCLNSLTSYHWIMPIIHGAFVQRKVNDYGRTLNLVLIARRSRHFAGTRYLKRGVSEQGKVANDVEHEQIVHDESKSPSSGIFSSYLQVRGSIPTFWTQESSVTMPKPPIELNRVDPTYNASRLHFEDLMKRYSSPVIVLDLVKQSEKREREVRVGNEFRHAIDYINNTIDDPRHQIRYCALDYSHISKHRNLDVSASLNECSVWAVNQTGFFCSAPKWKIVEGGIIKPFTEEDGYGAARLSEKLGVPVFPMEQNGVLRTNCIDCLDRTNVAQFSAGVEAIGQQLVVMGIRSKAKLDPSATTVRVLIDMYVDIGDSIALQYGGSEAHKKVSAESSESNITPIGKHKELLTSIRRYYSNAFTDRLKQDAMNLFLGYYLPYRHTVPLWEMETDYYLHNFHVKAGRGSTYSMKTYQRAFGIDWDDDYIGVSSKRSKDAFKHSRESFPRPVPVHREPHNGSHVDTLANETQRITRVRSRCKAQSDALSIWWKVALQTNLQQRMWMSLGPSQTESLLPPRYDRLYQPEKIAQFDKFFARGFAAPVRRSHSAQHSESAKDADSQELRRVVSAKAAGWSIANTSEDDRKSEGRHHALDGFVATYGLKPHFDTSLKLFIEHHDHSSVPVGSTLDYIGRLDSGKMPPREYERYVAPSDKLYSGPQRHREKAVEEFKACLHDYSLQADDVAGISQLAESAHLKRTLVTGQYCGLDRDVSAIEVATAVQEQFNAFDGATSEGMRLMEVELERRGLNTTGVKKSVADGWKGLSKAEKQYAEIQNATSDACRRSDLTNAASLKLYASAYDESSELSTADLIFLLGRKSDTDKQAHDRVPGQPIQCTSFVNKAKRLGIEIPSHEDINRKSPPLLQVKRRHSVPQGFEQINDDMFARKDNKFMVLNGAGVDSWNDTQPITKIFHAEDFLLSAVQ